LGKQIFINKFVSLSKKEGGKKMRQLLDKDLFLRADEDWSDGDYDDSYEEDYSEMEDLDED
jgi:hypothetical protein